MCKPKTGLPIFFTRYAIAPTIGSEAQHYTDEKGKVSEANRYGSFKYKSPGQTEKAHILLYNKINESKAPIVSDDFFLFSGKRLSSTIGDCTYYTQRVLRGGYLYIFDQNNDVWQSYFVTANGFLDPLPTPFRDIEKTTTELEPNKIPCQAQNYARASFFTIEKPDEAGTFWFTFSDVEWTKDVFERFKNMDDETRKKNMRSFEPQKWVQSASPKHDHAARIDNLANYVADFAENVNEDAFYFSPSACNQIVMSRSGFPIKNAFPLIARCGNKFYELESNRDDPDHLLMTQEEMDAKVPAMGAALYRWKKGIVLKEGTSLKKISASQQIINACKKISTHGVILALDDPAGIAMELATLMDHRVEAFSVQRRYFRKSVVSKNIIALKEFVYKQIKSRALEQVEKYEEWRIARLKVSEKQIESTKVFINDKYSKSERPTVPTVLAYFEESLKNKGGYNTHPYADRRRFQLKPADKSLMDNNTSYEMDLYIEKVLRPALAGLRDGPARTLKHIIINPDRLVPFSDDEYEVLHELIEKKQEEEWERYAAKYKETERTDFDKTYEEALLKYHKEIIYRMSEEQAEWLKSEQFANYIKYNFSTKDIRQGRECPYVLSQCIGGSQDKPAVAEVLSKWMRGKATDTGNPLMRALIFNNDTLAELFEKHREEIEKIKPKMKDMKDAKKWADRWIETIRLTEQLISEACLDEATDESLIKKAEETSNGVVTSNALVALVDSMANMSTAIARETLFGHSGHTVIPALDYLFYLISGVAAKELMNTEDEIASFRSAIGIHKRSHMVKFNVTGTYLQHAETMDAEHGIVDDVGEESFVYHLFEDLDRPLEEIFAKQKTIKYKGAISIEELISYIYEASHTSDSGKTTSGGLVGLSDKYRTETSILINTLHGQIFTNTEFFPKGYTRELEGSGIRGWFNRFVARWMDAEKLHPKIVESEKLFQDQWREKSAQLRRDARALTAENRADAANIKEDIKLKNDYSLVQRQAANKLRRARSARVQKQRYNFFRQVDLEMQNVHKVADERIASKETEIKSRTVDRTAIRTERLNVDGFRHSKRKEFNLEKVRNKEVFKGNTTMSAFAGIGFILSLVSTWGAYEQLESEKIWGRGIEGYSRIGMSAFYTAGGAVAFVGYTAATATAALAAEAAGENIKLAGRFARGLFHNGLSREAIGKILNVGKILGGIGLTIEFALAGADAAKAWSKGQRGLFVLHIGSGLLSVFAFFAFFGGPAGICLAALYILLNVGLSSIIRELKGDEIQVYLDECAFGYNPATLSPTDEVVRCYSIMAKQTP